jgi:hypothetical protein
MIWRFILKLWIVICYWSDLIFDTVFMQRGGFRRSLNYKARYTILLSQKGRERYGVSLYRRRAKAHELDLAQEH